MIQTTIEQTWLAVYFTSYLNLKLKKMELTTDYIKDFDGEMYQKQYYGTLHKSTKEGNVIQFALNSFHDMFTTDVDFGSRLLDVGTGPTIHTILSATRRVQHVDLSDYTPCNLKILKDWKDGKGQSQSIIQYEMELAGDGRSLSERENELRSKVFGIHRIDVKTERVFHEAGPPDVKYDVIMASFCLDSVSADKEIYKKTVQNISRLLKSEGFLIIMGVLEETFYRVGDVRFHCLYITAEEIRSIYEENGFKILKWSTLFPENIQKEVEDNDLTDFQNVFAMMAQKL